MKPLIYNCLSLFIINSLFLVSGFQTVSAGNCKDAFAEYIDLIPDSRVAIDYGTTPANKPVVLVLFALPNGNTIAWSAGKKMEPGDDWHYDIQHIRAQTEFIRAADIAKHYVVAYLQASMKAWTGHAAKYNGENGAENSYMLYPRLVDTLEQIVEKGVGRAVQELVLSSHSGGGRFMFNYISGVKEIPCKVSRLSFIDSNYGFEDSLHTAKLVKWLKAVQEHKLLVLSYVDTTVVFNGKPIVSSKGGTGYKTEQMYDCLRREMLPGFPNSAGGKRGVSQWTFHRGADTCFVRMHSANKQVQMLKKENPQGNIYHTVLVERNGLIHSLFFSSPLEEKGYKFWMQGRAYSGFIK